MPEIEEITLIRAKAEKMKKGMKLRAVHTSNGHPKLKVGEVYTIKRIDRRSDERVFIHVREYDGGGPYQSDRFDLID